MLQEYRIDLVVLAKYLQVLSGWLLRQAPPVINLPAFAGANPYPRAHQGGVKIISATAPYAPEELDGGQSSIRSGAGESPRHGSQPHSQGPRHGAPRPGPGRALSPGKSRAGLPQQAGGVA